MNAVTKIKPDPEPASLSAAMAIAFGAIEAATKSAPNPHFKSKYADLSGVIDAIKPALVANGLFFTQRPEPAQGGVQIETVLHYVSGESMSLGILFVPANKNDAQAYGSALTYARRYALVTAFGVPTEDDDGNAASRAPKAVEAPAVLDDAQWAEITALVQATQTDLGKFCGAYSIDSLKALPSAAFPKAKAQLERKLAQMVQA